MPQPRKIYLLDPRHLSPETIAVAFAKTSRSPSTFQEIANELSDEKSADFHEKWVVGYGHSSVAEHAVLHIALENVSRLAVECIESNRLASYTEKSSRYQVWDQDHFFVPPELSGHTLEKEYIALNKRLFEHYHIALDKVTEYLKLDQPQEENESDRAYTQRIKNLLCGCLPLLSSSKRPCKCGHDYQRPCAGTCHCKASFQPTQRSSGDWARS